MSWGLFIIWAGTAALIDVGWSWTLFGIALIILGGAATRWLKGLPIEWFWITMGIVLLTYAISGLFAISWPLAPLLVIGFGAWVLLSAFRGSHSSPH